MTRSLTLLVVLTGLLAAPAFGAGPQPRRAGQNAPPPSGQPGPGPDGPLSPGEVVAMLDAWAVVQAQDTLQLNDSQYGQFVIRLRRVQQVRRANQQQRNRIVQDLRKLAGPQAAAPFDEAATRERLKALREQDDRTAVELRRVTDALDELLDVRQQARFRIFEEMIERRKLDLLMRARQGAARRNAPGGP